MTPVLRADDLVVNLLALAEVAPGLPTERLIPLAAFVPDLDRVVAELDVLSPDILSNVEGSGGKYPSPAWERLTEICQNDLKLTAARIAVELFDVQGFRATVRAWRPARPAQTRLNDFSLAQRTQSQEPQPAGGIGPLAVRWDTEFSHIRRLVVLSKAALERPVEFAGWTDQLQWLAGWLGGEWPRQMYQP
jgi:hypothetical protein